MKIPIIEIKKNPSPSLSKNVIAFTCFLAAALLVAAIILWSQGVNPWYAYGRLFIGAFGSFYGWSETLTKAIPLMLCGLGLTVAFRASFWNIGAEGQLLFGAMAATGVALFVPITGPFLLPLIIAAGFLAGAAWGLLPAIFKGKLGGNEVIITLMMNYIAIELVKYLVTGPWKGAQQFGFPYTDKFPSAAQLPVLAGTRAYYPMLIIAIALAILLSIILKRTRLGYNIKVIGDNPNAARYAGISCTKTLLAVMIISGGLAGVAGAGEVAGVRHLLTTPEQISQGYGFTAIIVAWIAMRNPLAVIASSTFMGGLMVGGDVFQTSLGLPFQTINLFNGLLLFFLIVGQILVHYKIFLRGEE